MHFMKLQINDFSGLTIFFFQELQKALCTLCVFLGTCCNYFLNALSCVLLSTQVPCCCISSKILTHLRNVSSFTSPPPPPPPTHTHTLLQFSSQGPFLLSPFSQVAANAFEYLQTRCFTLKDSALTPCPTFQARRVRVICPWGTLGRLGGNFLKSLHCSNALRNLKSHETHITQTQPCS